jgi:hypothetical protein
MSSLPGSSRRRGWGDALCLEHEEVDFFPGVGESCEDAKAVCARCLVQSECLQYAIELVEYHGVWGGTSGQQRRALQRAESRGESAKSPRESENCDETTNTEQHCSCRSGRRFVLQPLCGGPRHKFYSYAVGNAQLEMPGLRKELRVVFRYSRRLLRVRGLLNQESRWIYVRDAAWIVGALMGYARYRVLT